MLLIIPFRLIITAQKMDVGLVNMRISPASLRVDTDNKGSVFYVDFNEPSAGSEDAQKMDVGPVNMRISPASL